MTPIDPTKPVEVTWEVGSRWRKVIDEEALRAPLPMLPRLEGADGEAYDRALAEFFDEPKGRER